MDLPIPLRKKCCVRHSGLGSNPIHIETQILRLTTLRGDPPGPEGSVQKLSVTRTYMQAAQVADRLLRPYQQLWSGSPHAVDDGHWSFQSLFSRRYGIAGGTDEVQKNIIGERQLSLPK